MADKRSVETIEQDLALARQRLSENLSRLVSEVHPRAVRHRMVTEHTRRVRRGIEDVQTRAKDTGRFMLSFFKDESGWKPVPVAAAVVVGAVVTYALTRKK
ncbi:MAG: DUF3618 domain-containing protein [Propionibacteriaceae bacterium]|jgi:anti-sigma-K factor RskA|nr:DUF3618 domain-containing protein [Propionibacteriaceae bacterium]